MSEQLVLVLSGASANDAVHGMMTEFADALLAIDLPVVHIANEPAELQFALDKMIKGEVRFALTWLGFGQELSVIDEKDRRKLNAWDALGVPLVKIHADQPAYFADRHRDMPKTSVNLYTAEEFFHFRRRWMPDVRTIAARIPPFAMAAIARRAVDPAKRRLGKLVFLKNGNAPAALRALWQERLAPPIARLVTDMADDLAPQALRAGPIAIADYAADVLAQRGIAPETATRLLPFFAAQLDDYVRRVKSETIARALLDLPVIVQGDAWEHVDFTGRRAQLVPGQDFIASRRIFAEELGIIDMAPNLDSSPHDRMQRAAGSYAVALTNAQGWLAAGFPGMEDMTFEFDAESIRSRVADVLARPDHYLEMGIAYGERFREMYPRETCARRIVEVAELGALTCGRPQPSLQPFFIWPTAS